MIELFPLAAILDAVLSTIVFVLVAAILTNAAGRHVGPARATATLLAFLGSFGKVGLCVLDLAFWFQYGTLFAVEPDRLVYRATLVHITAGMLLLSIALLLRASFRATDTTLSSRKRAELLRNVKPPITSSNVRREQEGLT